MAERKTLKLGNYKAANKGGLYFTSNDKDINFIMSGSALLDCVLGGGWAIGRVSNIIGDKSSGKTLLAMEALTNFINKYPDGTAIYTEVEAAFDEKYAEALGIPVNKICFKNDLFTVEDWFRDLDDLMQQLNDQKSDAPVMYVLDSLDALSDAAEMDRDIDKGSFGASKAKQLSELFRRINKQMANKNFHLMIISQVRDNIGVTFGRKVTRSGGRALDFYASQVVYLAQVKTHKKQKNKVTRATGVRIKAKCDKNKVALPFRECEFDILFGYGVDDFGANIAWLEEVGELHRVTDGGTKKLLTDADKLEDDEYFDLVDQVANTTKNVWVKVENVFLPGRRKRR